ncbi:matrix extracellular phosphoglycoprotein [Macrotis lagotis]|uniref:matrix extracellular phosphoglycoprotein n=1 Tax=Macrotis lagotis TaxID=92651 RepID=UPI003D681AE2
MQVSILVTLCTLTQVDRAPKKEGNKDHVPLHHIDKGNKQEISLKENVIQKSDKAQDISAGLQVPMKDRGTGSSKTSYHEDAIYMSFTGNDKAGHGVSGSKDPPDQEAHGAIFINKNVQHDRKYNGAPKLWVVEEDEEENKTGNFIHNTLEETKYPEPQGKGNEDIANKQRGVQKQNISTNLRVISHVQYTSDYSKLSPKHIQFPYDFEGSGQGKEDDDLSPSRGETVLPDPEITDGYTSVLDPDKTKEGNNEVPEKEEYDLNSTGRNSIGNIVETDVSKIPSKEKSIIDNQIAKGSNSIIGSTDYRKLPGKEGDGFGANTGDTYQETVGIHHSKGSLKKHSIISQHSRKNSNDIIEGKEISKHDKDDTKVGTGSSMREQKTKTDKKKIFNKGKSQGLPSHGHTYSLKGENEIKNRVNLHSGYNKDKSISKFSSNNRKNHYATQRKFSSTKSHQVPGRKRFWGPINAHSNKKFRPSKRNDSSDSTSSDSSDSDSDQSTEYFQDGSGN